MLKTMVWTKRNSTTVNSFRCKHQIDSTNLYVRRLYHNKPEQNNKLTHSLTHSLIRSLIHSLTHSLSHSLSFSYSLTNSHINIATSWTYCYGNLFCIIVRDHCDQWALVQLYISCREHVTFQWHDDDSFHLLHS
jgi:hypothetical protein